MEDVAAQRIAFGEAWVVEIAGRIALHADALHDVLREMVLDVRDESIDFARLGGGGVGWRRRSGSCVGPGDVH
jgi:hypothetical protein